MTTDINSRILELGIQIPNPRTPSANYIPFVKADKLIFISGQVSMAIDGLIAGKLGLNIDVENGKKAARACGLNLLGQLKIACEGNLNKVQRVVKLGGFVNSTPNFIDAPTIINGASDLIASVFGEAGMHTRAAVSANSLPLGVSVEVDAIFELN